jgi:hypothetical protein
MSFFDGSLMLTVAPATPAPDESRTEPTIEPVVSCARVEKLKLKIIAVAMIKKLAVEEICLLIFYFFLSFTKIL